MSRLVFSALIFMSCVQMVGAEVISTSTKTSTRLNGVWTDPRQLDDRPWVDPTDPKAWDTTLPDYDDSNVDALLDDEKLFWEMMLFGF